jgi:hypothetical protein
VEWTAESSAEWLTLADPVSGTGNGKIAVSIAENTGTAVRTATVTVTADTLMRTLTVTQPGIDPQLEITGDWGEITAEGGDFSLTVASNMEWMAESDSPWLTFDPASGTGNDKIVVSIAENTGTEIREAMVFVTVTADTLMRTLTVRQAAAVFNKIPLTVDMLSTNAQEPSEGPISNLVDGNPGSYFHSRWSGGGITEAHYFQVALDESVKGCKFLYQNRNNGNGKPIDVSITVSADGENWNELTHLTSDDNLPVAAGSTYESGYFTAKAPFKYFRFTVNKTNSGDAPTFFNMAEFELYYLQE